MLLYFLFMKQDLCIVLLLYTAVYYIVLFGSVWFVWICRAWLCLNMKKKEINIYGICCHHVVVAVVVVEIASVSYLDDAS